MIANELGHGMTPLLPRAKDPATWLTADGYIVRYTGYIDQEPLHDAFQRAVREGRRVLVMSTPDANSWLMSEFGLSLLTDRHFVVERWSDPDWESEPGKDQIVARPASATVAMDSILDGVERVVMNQPHVVRAFDTARPLLQVAAGDLITTEDLRRATTDLASEDQCVAAMSRRLGHDVAQVVLLGDGSCLTDSNLGLADNRQFATNLMRWLGGSGLTRGQLAATAGRLLDEIEVELASLVVGMLRDRLGADWHLGLPATRLEKIRERRPDAELATSLDLSDKVATILHDETMLKDVGLVGGRSKTKSKELWGRAVTARHAIRHPERLGEVDVTSGQALLNELEELVAHLHAARAQWQASLDNDPRNA